MCGLQGCCGLQPGPKEGLPGPGVPESQEGWAGPGPTEGPGGTNARATVWPWPSGLDSRFTTETTGRSELLYWAAAGWASPVQVVGLDVGGDLGLPLVPIVQQLLLVVQQLLVCLRGELKVGALRVGDAGAAMSGASQEPLPQPPPHPGCAHLDNGVHRAGLLAEAAVDALGHVDVVAGGPAAAVGPRLSLDGDGLARGAGAGSALTADWASRPHPQSAHAHALRGLIPGPRRHSLSRLSVQLCPRRPFSQQAACHVYLTGLFLAFSLGDIFLGHLSPRENTSPTGCHLLCLQRHLGP